LNKEINHLQIDENEEENDISQIEDKDTEGIFEKYDQQKKIEPNDTALPSSNRESGGNLDKAQSEIFFDSSKSGGSKG